MVKMTHVFAVGRFSDVLMYHECLEFFVVFAHFVDVLMITRNTGAKTVLIYECEGQLLK